MFSATLSRLPLISILSFILGTVILFASFSTATMMIGGFLLAYSVVCSALHLGFSLMRDHVAWKRNFEEHRNSVVKTVDPA